MISIMRFSGHVACDCIENDDFLVAARDFKLKIFTLNMKNCRYKLELQGLARSGLGPNATICEQKTIEIRSLTEKAKPPSVHTRGKKVGFTPGFVEFCIERESD